MSRIEDRRRHRRARKLRPARFDELGLRRAFSDRMLPFLVAAMAFLALLALAGAYGAASLAQRWQQGAAAAITIQVPEPQRPAEGGGTSTRQDAAVAIARGTPGIASARLLDAKEIDALLRPWLGDDLSHLALPVPAVLDVRLSDPSLMPDALGERLRAAVPGIIVEQQGIWLERLSALARSLQACAALALLVVGAVAVAVVAVATRAGLTARRDAIAIVHGLGATDNYIAHRFAGRAMLLAATGGAGGTLCAVPALLYLAHVVAPFAVVPPGETPGPLGLPGVLWAALPLLPVGAAAIGWLTAHATVRAWLLRLT